MGDRTWVNLKCRKCDLIAVKTIIDGPPPWHTDAPDPFDEVLEEDELWIEGQIHEANYGLYGPMEELAEAGIPFVASSGAGGDYGPAIIACDGKRMFHLGSSWDGWPFVEINKNGDFMPKGIMQRIREYYIIVSDAERIIEEPQQKTAPQQEPEPPYAHQDAGIVREDHADDKPELRWRPEKCEGTIDKGKPCPNTIKESENMCQCCGLYFCDTCWDKHDDCEPCSDCGQIHIHSSCPASPA
ncbi:MAG: hypothetical protein E2P05_02260 [Acidobacteria bacterium]|nr:MAG: hypothetical protein E2P05_02260 [Acidobacteriota bacterium]